MKSLILIISLFSFSSFAGINTSALDANIEEITANFEFDSCSSLYDQITEAYTNLGKIMGAVEIILEINPNADVREAQEAIRQYSAQMAQVDVEYKAACVK